MSSRSCGPSMKAALSSGVISLNPRRRPSTSGPESFEAAVEDVFHQDMYEVLFTLLRIFSAFRKFGAPGTCELGNGHPPFCAKQLRHASALHFISDDVVLRRIFGNQLEYYAD